VLKTLVLAFLLCSLPRLVVAQEPQPAEDSGFKITTGSSYFPYVDEKALAGGWSLAVIDAVFKQMGQQISIETLPGQRGYKWASEGRYLGTFPYVFTSARAELFFYSKPINLIPIHIYTKRNRVLPSLSDLLDARLCLPYGYSLSPELEAFIH
jgi:polar amino acid transport system substrate-binding protein